MLVEGPQELAAHNAGDRPQGTKDGGRASVDQGDDEAKRLVCALHVLQPGLGGDNGHEQVLVEIEVVDYGGGEVV
jgi:hypothetical protein